MQILVRCLSILKGEEEKIGSYSRAQLAKKAKSVHILKSVKMTEFFFTDSPPPPHTTNQILD